MEAHNSSSKLARTTEHGRGDSRSCDTGRHSSSYSLTFLQLQELKQQMLIYKYIETGVPVPHHLLHPICKSLANSFTHLKGLGFIGAMEYCNYYKKEMEAEPGRCRRTDGKKWRCSRDVVRPDQKYCQRHLHEATNSRKILKKPFIFNCYMDECVSKC